MAGTNALSSSHSRFYWWSVSDSVISVVLVPYWRNWKKHTRICKAVKQLNSKAKQVRKKYAFRSDGVWWGAGEVAEDLGELAALAEDLVCFLAPTYPPPPSRVSGLLTLFASYLPSIRIHAASLYCPPPPYPPSLKQNWQPVTWDYLGLPITVWGFLLWSTRKGVWLPVLIDKCVLLRKRNLCFL